MMNRKFKVIISALTLFLFNSFSANANLLGDEICFSAMLLPQQPQQLIQPLPIPQPPGPVLPADCGPDQIPIPVNPIEIELVALQLVSQQPLPIEPIFNIDILAPSLLPLPPGQEIIAIDIMHPVIDPTQDLFGSFLPGFPPQPFPWPFGYSFWFEDLNWLNPDGSPMDGSIIDVDLIAFDLQGQPFQPNFPPVLTNFGPNSVHLDILALDFEPNDPFAPQPDPGISRLELVLITEHHDIPEPNLILLLALSIGFMVVRRKYRPS